MKREASITIRTPAGLKLELEARARQEDRSLADEIIALLYRGMTIEAGPAQLPPDRVWKDLLEDKHTLATRSASADEKAELLAVKNLEKEGKLRTLTAHEALAMLGEPAEEPEFEGVPKIGELMALTERLARGLGALKKNRERSGRNEVLGSP